MTTEDMQEVKAAKQKALVQEEVTKSYRKRYQKDKVKVVGKLPRAAADPRVHTSPLYWLRLAGRSSGRSVDAGPSEDAHAARQLE